jgi:hypothetical protein
MRNEQQIKTIKDRIVEPYSIENFLSPKEVSYLINMFDSHKDHQIDPTQRKTYKNTGPITLDLRTYAKDPVLVEILNRLKVEIGNYEITAAFFFFTNYPHIIHNDDLFQLPDGIYKGITLPLKFNRKVESDELPQLCLFDQFYFHGPSKFFKGSEQDNIPTYYNQKLYEYSNVDGVLDHNSISEEVYNKLFTHLEPQWLDGLSVHSTIPNKIGSAIIFDSVRLHSSSDFRTIGIESKLAISIFTTIPTEIKDNSTVAFYDVTSSKPA